MFFFHFKHRIVSKMLHRSGMQIIFLNLSQVKKVSPSPKIIVFQRNLAKSAKRLSSQQNTLWLTDVPKNIMKCTGEIL